VLDGPTDTDMDLTVQGQSNCYTVHVNSSLLYKLMKLPSQITFHSRHLSLPLPSEEYLAIHAACCEVAHMSGAAEYIDKMERDNGFHDVPVI